MRAAAIERFGSPEVLAVISVSVPVLDPGEVLIAIDTAGVGSWDADIREGWSPSGKSRFPLILGSDGSGKIAAVGSRVRRFHPGDKVYAYSFDNPKGGFYAEYAAVAANQVALLPKRLAMVEAGAVPTTGLTALQGIDDALGVKSGDSVLITGASGGVGTLAVQFAKLRGARVLAVASGDDGVALARRLGAAEAIDGRREDICAAARRFAPGGVDSALVLAASESVEQCADAIRPSGHLAYPNGVEPAPKKRHGIGVTSYDAAAGVKEFARLDRAITAARVVVPIAASYSLEQADRAHQRLASGHVLGKIVLRVREKEKHS
jgi:NADPH:quinone reductase-like Zn-dependent oxidoreductase